MKVSEKVLKYEVCNPSSESMPVIIVAAGNSTRMGGVNKQLACIAGVPVIIRTMLAFENCDAVSNIILVTRTEDLFEMQMLSEKYRITKLSDIVCGAATRQQSVEKGLSRVKATEKKILIHDGARPLVDKTIIESVAGALKTHVAVTCAVKIKDTVKQVDESGKVIKTLPRESLVAVQTPQGVSLDEYRQAIGSAGGASQFTDDAALMEAAGFEVYTVPGSYR
ncbi:MAG: IspD/TarI family cytidylyltransferase, partial [Acutalibacteraceae bacterium]